MPELPEVETIARSLRVGGKSGEPVIGLTVEKVHLLWQRTLATPTRGDLLDQLIGQTIQGVTRRGKYLILNLSRDALLVHLRMSGDIRVEPDLEDGINATSAQLHDRLILRFSPTNSGKLRLAFNDPRKFGRVWMVQNAEEVTGSLGPEPLLPEFTSELFYQMLQKARRQIKPLLLDQTFLAGMGNIYTDEALHLAHIHPMRLSNSLSFMEAEELWAAIRNVLGEGIRRNGASIDWVYRGGEFQNSFHVYHRTNEPCLQCGTAIERIIVGQRSTHICPTCQRLFRI